MRLNALAEIYTMHSFAHSPLLCTPLAYAPRTDLLEHDVAPVPQHAALARLAPRPVGDHFPGPVALHSEAPVHLGLCLLELVFPTLH